MKITLLIGLMVLPIATACAATWKCVDSTGHQYNSSQSVPIDKCTVINSDEGHVSAVSDAIPSKGVAKEKKKKTKSTTGGVFIGMSTEEVRTVGWGRPDSINRTTTARGTREQWVYGGRNYLYFEDGFLTKIQN